MDKFNYGIFIGRLQPLHNSHLALIEQALDECKNLIIVIGSAHSSRNIKNPFTYAERVSMISAQLGKDVSRVQFIPVRDYFYNENMWLSEIQSKVGAITGDDPSIALYGSYKDESSYYVNLFPQWKFRPAKDKTTLGATDIRNSMFENPMVQSGFNDKVVCWNHNVPKEVVRWINTNFIFKEANSNEVTQTFKNLQDEHKYIKEYKDKWKGVPYPPTFVTTDAVVMKSGHVLVINRKCNPGKGLIALPGGFLMQDEFIEDGMLRELKEETRIKVDKPVLRNHIINNRVFDYPNRSARGRIITHAYHIDLGNGELPEVKGSDDASGAFWMPLADAIQSEDKFFEDHWHMVYYFMQERRSR